MTTLAPAARRGAARLATAILVGTSCADPTAPLPRAGAPVALEITGSWFGTGSTTIRLDGGRLRYAHTPWGTTDGRPTDTATVTPDSASWAAFWAAADRVGLRTWPRECANRDVVDGGGISVDIAYGGGRVEVVTSNAYPGRGGRCERRDVTPEMTEFFDAVRALVGRPFPGRTPAVAALPREGPPLALRVVGWRFPSGSHEVALRGDTLVLTRRPYNFPITPDTTSTLVPTADAWRAFWEAAERAGLRYWPRDCRDDGVLDGASYQLDVTVPAGRVQAVAVNATPTPAGECLRYGMGASRGALDGLGAFLEAVSRLIGRPFP